MQISSLNNSSSILSKISNYQKSSITFANESKHGAQKTSTSGSQLTDEFEVSEASQKELERNANAENELTEQEKKEVQELKNRDREVHAHEAAHLAAAGGYARSGAKFSFEVGPDGKRYAVGGEVSIDVSKVSGDPVATIQKNNVVRSAALAPANPSGADKAIAAQAASTAAQARAEQIKENSTTNNSEFETDSAKMNLQSTDSAFKTREGISAYSAQANFALF